MLVHQLAAGRAKVCLERVRLELEACRLPRKVNLCQKSWIGHGHDLAVHAYEVLMNNSLISCSLPASQGT